MSIGAERLVRYNSGSLVMVLHATTPTPTHTHTEGDGLARFEMSQTSCDKILHLLETHQPSATLNDSTYEGGSCCIFPAERRHRKDSLAWFSANSS